MIASTTTEPENPQDSEAPDPAELAKILSEIVTLKIIANCDLNGANTSRNAMEEAMQIFENPEDQKEFEEGMERNVFKNMS